MKIYTEAFNLEIRKHLHAIRTKTGASGVICFVLTGENDARVLSQWSVGEGIPDTDTVVSGIVRHGLLSAYEQGREEGRAEAQSIALSRAPEAPSG